MGSITTGLAVLGATLYLVRSENVRVTFRRQDRPRLSLTRREVIEPVPDLTN